MSNGLKSLAKELPKHGRYGDTIVAHINAQEAALLKALGGSGTINPTTGLPEFGMFGIGGGGGFLGTGINKNASDPVSNALSNNPVSKGISSAVQGAGNAIDQTLVGLDKTVNKAIPGGWGTVGMVAGSMMGLPTYAMVGLGALNGSGVMHKGGKFNLQGALMGGAMAYGMSELGEYMRAAAPASESSAAMLPVSETGSAVTSSGVNAATGEIGSGLAGNASGVIPDTSSLSPPVGDFPGSMSDPTAGMAQAYTPPPPPSVTSQLMSGNVGDALSQMGTNISEGASNAWDSLGRSASNAWDSAGNTLDKATTLDTYTNYAKDRAADFGKTTEGIKSILTGNANPAAAEAVKAGTITSPAMATAATIYGGMGVADAEAQRQYLKDQLAAGNIAQAEYNAAMAEIERSANIARQAVASSPFSTNPNRDVSIGDTYYGRTGEDENLYSRLAREGNLYAVGGPVDDESGLDEARGLSQGNMQNGFMGGGIPGYADGGMIPSYDLALRGLSKPAFSDGAVGGMPSFAAGGQPHFLSGGGDGMSDSIPATIEGKQEARLADGEFVIPADVVSHLGNGSSKAGAKQLYSMMNKVRKARTGNPAQGKQINPRKYLPA